MQVGDRVTIDSVVGCGICYFCRKGSRQFCKEGFEFGISHDGGCQDFLVVPEENAFPISDDISFEEGAILDMEVYAALTRCGLDNGDVALVVGDGPAGLIACQLLRYMGARKVILSGRSPGRISKARQLGLADRVIDSRCEDVRMAVREETQDIGVNISVDCAGSPGSARDVLDCVTVGGTVLLYALWATARQLRAQSDRVKGSQSFWRPVRPSRVGICHCIGGDWTIATELAYYPQIPARRGKARLRQRKEPERWTCKGCLCPLGWKVPDSSIRRLRLSHAHQNPNQHGRAF